MMLATLTISAERLAPAAALLARATGTAATMVGLAMIALPA